MMREISSKARLHHLLLFLTSFALHIFSGLSDHAASSKEGTDYESHSASNGKNGSNVTIIIILLVVVVLLSLILFKFWQKKKRDEQYAQLLKLFEDDDELELELGLRD